MGEHECSTAAVKNSIADGLAATDCMIYFVPPPSAIFTSHRNDGK
jgi:hypothetical protein